MQNKAKVKIGKINLIFCYKMAYIKINTVGRLAGTNPISDYSCLLIFSLYNLPEKKKFW
jgi:hypothetical protein